MVKAINLGPVYGKTVTYVSGIKCYLCARYGPEINGGPGMTRHTYTIYNNPPFYFK